MARGVGTHLVSVSDQHARAHLRTGEVVGTLLHPQLESGDAVAVHPRRGGPSRGALRRVQRQRQGGVDAVPLGRQLPNHAQDIGAHPIAGQQMALLPRAVPQRFTIFVANRRFVYLAHCGVASRDMTPLNRSPPYRFR
eukprot:gene6777-biopygen17953